MKRRDFFNTVIAFTVPSIFYVVDQNNDNKIIWKFKETCDKLLFESFDVAFCSMLNIRKFVIDNGYDVIILGGINEKGNCSFRLLYKKPESEFKTINVCFGSDEDSDEDFFDKVPESFKITNTDYVKSKLIGNAVNGNIRYDLVEKCVFSTNKNGIDEATLSVDSSISKHDIKGLKEISYKLDDHQFPGWTLEKVKT